MNKKIVYYSIHCYDKLDIAVAIQRISGDPNLTYEVEVFGDVTIVSALPMPKTIGFNPYDGRETTTASDFLDIKLPKQGFILENVVSAFENSFIDQALLLTNGNKTRASKLLQMNITTLIQKLRKRGMIVENKRKARQ